MQEFLLVELVGKVGNIKTSRDKWMATIRAIPGRSKGVVAPVVAVMLVGLTAAVALLLPPVIFCNGRRLPVVVPPGSGTPGNRYRQVKSNYMLILTIGDP